MAHEIEGNNAFYVATPAWHGLGTLLTDAPSIESAWHLAYPHTLFKLDLEAVLDAERLPLKNSKVIIRDDGTEFKAVGADFELIQPIEVLETFRPMLDSKLVTLEAGGSLRGGSQLWALGKVQNADAEIVPNDRISGYVLMYTGFDGSLRVGMSRTNVRVVCANTLAASMDATKSNDYRFKHTKNVRLRIDDAALTIKSTLEQFHQATQAYKALARKPMAAKTMVSYVRRVLLTDHELQNDDAISTKKHNTVQDVIELIDTQRGLDLAPLIRGTAWQAYNAVSEHITHHMGRSVDTRLQNQWFGDGNALNQKALSLAMTM